MFILILLLTIALLIFVCLSVFGGGQVFIPIFVWLWKTIANVFNLKMAQETIDNVIAATNSSPGIVSIKFALFTGYLISEGNWWGYLIMILTYIIFIFPAIFIMLLAMKYLKKFEQNRFLKSFLIIVKPVIAGILVALAIQLLIPIVAPGFTFNTPESYFSFNSDSVKKVFFSSWRLITLFIFIAVAFTTTSFILYKKYSSLYAILINIVLAFLLFQPWL
ncbi:chromate transporter [Mycoplasmopsis gallinacea]|uniref:Chromate transporter n=1 Tax=Mycoplasmopsis gallinacea TaxID=29556 RepID=A0A6H0V1K0_9BACT|nr:chromate transporter [Mycoplasmopsis gallinacea]QIW62211.1 chromate transporter [Mycoplasmopsis gallinacea]